MSEVTVSLYLGKRSQIEQKIAPNLPNPSSYEQFFQLHDLSYRKNAL